MDGRSKTSILDAITRDLLSACLKSKTEIASAATPKFRCQKESLIRNSVITIQCYSIYLGAFISLLRTLKSRFNVAMKWDLFSVTQSCVQMKNLLMAIKLGNQIQTDAPTVSQFKTERTRSQTRKENGSQLLNLKYGK